MTTMTLQALQSLVADDAFASTFQSVSQYRGALLRQFDSLTETAPVSLAHAGQPTMMKLQIKDSGALDVKQAAAVAALRSNQEKGCADAKA